MPALPSGRASRRGLVVIGLALALVAGLAAVRSVVSSSPAPAACPPGGATAAADNNAGLAQFRHALSTVGSKPVNVVFVGDSITEGFGVTSDSARFQDLLRHDLQRAYDPPGVAGGQGYVPLWHGTGWKGPQQWTTGTTDPNGIAPVFISRGLGLGLRGGGLTGGQFAQLTTSGDRFWVMYTQSPVGWDMGVSVDGGPVQVVHTNAQVTKSGRPWDTGPLPRGSHTIRVSALPTAGGGQSVSLDGAMIFDGDGGAATGQGRGVRTWDGGLGGTIAASFASGAGNYGDSTNDVINPDLIVIGLGANDSQTYSSDKYAQFLEAIIARYRTGTPTTPPAPNASILLWIEPNWANQAPSVWQAYVNAAYEVAQSEAAGLVDMYQRMGTAVSGDFFGDAIHPTDAGHRMIADGLGQALGVVGCAPLRGVVRDSSGKAIAAACVTAVDAGTAAPISFAHTGPDGGYTFWTPPGSYRLHVWDCAGLGYASTWHGGRDASSAVAVAGGTSGLRDTVAKAAPITGRLTNSVGAPVAGLCVVAVDAATGAHSSTVGSAADGGYAIVNPPGMANKLFFFDCTGQGYQPIGHAGSADEANATVVAPGTTGLVDVVARA
jgi:lysophospholipase L1-like esterase